MTELTHHIEFCPAYDKRNPDPKKDYGIHNMTLTFYVKGPKGTVQWQLYTGWYLAANAESVRRSNDRFEREYGHLMESAKLRPWATDLGYHAKKPQYDDQTCMTQSCKWTDDEPCYYDGSSLNAELLVEGFLGGGEEWLWPQLEAYYRHVFEKADWPFREQAAEAKARGAYI